MQPRSYQSNIIRRVRLEMAAGKRRVLVQLPTGAGKTVVATLMMLDAIKKEKVCWFVAHRNELVLQARGQIRKLGIDPGIIKAGFEENLSRRVQIASIQTLHSRMDDAGYKKPDFLIVDEAHHAVSDQWREVLKKLGNPWTILLTATPYRSDGKGLGDVADAIVVGPTPRELVDRGVLMDPEIWAPSDLEDGLVGNIVETWMNVVSRGKRTLVFATNKEHAKALCVDFTLKGVLSSVVDEDTSQGLRLDSIESLRDGSIEVLINCQVLTEGFDLPSLDVVVLARRTTSEALFVQMVGRVMRMHDGKMKAQLIDHGGNVLRLGSPLAFRPADLTGRRPRRMELLDEIDRVKCCDKCLRIMPGLTTVCPFCGSTSVPQLPKIDERKKLEKWDGASGSPLSERISHFRSCECEEILKKQKVWAGANKYRSKYGMFPQEDKAMMGALENHERVTFWRRRKKR